LGTVAMGLVAANFFPDQTWRVLNAAQIRYGGIISRLMPIPSGADRNVQEWNIYESLVRDLIGRNRRSRVVFLRVDGSDPTDELMARFNASGLPVMKASEAHFDLAVDGYVDRSTGKRGVLIQVGSIRWVFGDRVEVNGGLGCGQLCGFGGIYQIVKSKGRWTVDGCRDRWDS
jgi:hypothetical protein